MASRANIDREFNEALVNLGIDMGAYWEDSETMLVYPKPGYESLGDVDVFYIEYEKQQGGNRLTFPENIEKETRIIGFLEGGEIREPEDYEYTWIRDQLQNIDKEFDSIDRGLLQSHLGHQESSIAEDEEFYSFWNE